MDRSVPFKEGRGCCLGKKISVRGEKVNKGESKIKGCGPHRQPRLTLQGSRTTHPISACVVPHRHRYLCWLFDCAGRMHHKEKEHTGRILWSFLQATPNLKPSYSFAEGRSLPASLRPSRKFKLIRASCMPPASSSNACIA